MTTHSTEMPKKISGEVWKAFKQFCQTKDWDTFVNQGRAITKQYQGAEKALAEDMFLAFVAYLEAKEKEL